MIIRANHASAAALLVTGDDRYLLQQREDLPHVSYPGLWGLFGGVVDPGESPKQAIEREILEELCWTPPPLTYLTRVLWDLRFDGGGVCERYIFIGEIDETDLEEMDLTEGADLGLFRLAGPMPEVPLIPPDLLAIHTFERRFEHEAIRRSGLRTHWRSTFR